jgi:uncharacterized protein YbbK (DUF523 family)
MSPKIKLGISSCLLGNCVRYDGGHKYDSELPGALVQEFEQVPICPEAECGMTIPREPLCLEGTPENPRIVTVRTHVDHSVRMRAWATERIAEIEREKVCGYIFKSKSPSCGLRDVKIIGSSGVAGAGAGFFAAMFIRHFPMMPVEEENRLHDPTVMNDFISRVRAYKRSLELE